MDKKIFLVFLILGFALATPVLAQNIAQNFPQFPYQTWWNPDALATFLGVPSDWLVVPKVIYYVIIPFIVAMTITYGILTELNIFRSPGKANKINIILSFAMAFLLLPSGILTIIVTYFYAFNTFVGLIGFGILFLFGTIMWVYGTAHRFRLEYGSTAKIAKDINSLNKAIQGLEGRHATLLAQLNQPGRKPEEIAKIKKDMKKIEDEHTKLVSAKADLLQQMKSAGI